MKTSHILTLIAVLLGLFWGAVLSSVLLGVGAYFLALFFLKFNYGAGVR